MKMLRTISIAATLLALVACQPSEAPQQSTQTTGTGGKLTVDIGYRERTAKGEWRSCGRA